MHLPLAQLRLGVVDVSAIAFGVDERVDRVLRGGACDELAISAPRSRMVRNPDVNGETAQHAQTALAVGRLFWVLLALEHSRIADADDVQHALAIADGE